LAIQVAVVDCWNAKQGKIVMMDLKTCDKCLAGHHDECEDWPRCLCALAGHRKKIRKPRRWGRRNEPGKK
jgi:hypothetical protein